MALQRVEEESKPQPKWTVGQKCEIYSKMQRKWIRCEVIEVFKDDEGEWVKVRFGRTTVEIPLESSDIRTIANERKMELSNDWKKGAQCEVFSHRRGEWIEGRVINMYTDEMGEWYTIRNDHFICILTSVVP